MGQVSLATLRVRYQETDQMGVVYHGNYLNWFEVGRTELLRQLGQDYRTAEEKGLMLPVMEVSIRYQKPAKYDDIVDIRTTITEYSGVKLTFSYQIYRNEELLVTGQSAHCWTDHALKPIGLKRKWPELHELIEEMMSGNQNEAN
jgi:acyl-CoA thioester hydrolase